MADLKCQVNLDYQDRRQLWPKVLKSLIVNSKADYWLQDQEKIFVHKTVHPNLIQPCIPFA